MLLYSYTYVYRSSLYINICILVFQLSCHHFILHDFLPLYYTYPITPQRGAQFRSAQLFFASPSGKMILNTKKKITMDTPPVMIVTRML